ncbi:MULTISPECIES: ABC transporter permease [unclassified Oceanispirochaeta]|uniref:ABC transporter permease n=1 Tax=unclassified Oceanispirochaeta TaxID=2635722 RepID=UPI000E0965AC|nr:MULTISPECIES: ABC transporter permease [unclassified Oceanispirochaeta]MBF9014624.1 ABC transporter permease [Oceanispirochaeta sp. M2]NPD70880.1 ABC transporter permease [Oceanispirochaeta sp. M1]RDG34159.1 ABC transporter permease [Oceanispirochaeta sp. M1]
MLEWISKNNPFKKQMLLSILVMLCLFLSFTAPGFFTIDNFLNVLRNTSMQGIIAFGMTMVMIAGEIDLSVGSTVAFTGCLTAWIVKALLALGVGAPLAVCCGILGALTVGYLLGVFSASVRNRFNVPTFIITLALMTALSGFANLITGGFPIVPFPMWFNFIGGGYVLGIPVPAIMLVVVFFIVNFIMTSTTFGRAVYAIGGNMEAARLSGIKVANIKMAVMGLTSMLMAVAGIMVSSQIMSGTASTARGWELDVISAVVIGGTSMNGGSGSVKGTFIGVIFLGVVVNGMTLMNINEYWQYVVKGFLILGAVLLNVVQENRKLNSVADSKNDNNIKSAVIG